MTAIASPNNNPYENLRGVDPRVLDTVEVERERSDQIIDSELIDANPQFVIHALAKAREKLASGVPSDKSYIEGALDMLGALRKISASKSELDGLLLENPEIVGETPVVSEKRWLLRRRAAIIPKVAILSIASIFSAERTPGSKAYDI